MNILVVGFFSWAYTLTSKYNLEVKFLGHSICIYLQEKPFSNSCTIWAAPTTYEKPSFLLIFASTDAISLFNFIHLMYHIISLWFECAFLRWVMIMYSFLCAMAICISCLMNASSNCLPIFSISKEINTKELIRWADKTSPMKMYSTALLIILKKKT